MMKWLLRTRVVSNSMIILHTNRSFDQGFSWRLVSGSIIVGLMNTGFEIH